MLAYLNPRNTLLIVATLTLFRLYLSATLQLHPDEAYYWMWSLHPDFGYFDHSPMVAYFIWLTTLFAKSEFWVRLSGTLVTLAASALTWHLALRLFGSIPVSAGSVILFNVFPLTMPGLLVITPDVPLFLFSALSTCLFWQTMHSRKAWLWYALGISFGLALLSKYTAFLLLPGMLLYLLLTDDRYWLKTPHPWLAALLGLLCFLPVVFWNSRHGWVSFLFQLHHGFDSEGYAYQRVSEFFGSQLILIGPVTWILGMYAAIKAYACRNKQQLFLLFSAVPVIVFFGLISVNKLAAPNWPAFAYFSFGILITQYFLGSHSKAKQALWFGAVLSSLLTSAIITLHARYSVLPLAKFSTDAAVIDVTNWFYGWRELGSELEKYPDMTLVITPSHQLSAEILYYTGGKMAVSTDETARPSQFGLLPQPADLSGKNGLYVWSDNDATGPYQNYFAATRGAAMLSIRREGVTIRRYHIVPGLRRVLPPATRNLSAANVHQF